MKFDPELTLKIMQVEAEADRIWQDKYTVGDKYKTLTIVSVNRHRHQIQVVMPDGTTDWIDGQPELGEIKRALYSKEKI